jgi:hypothetical protein
VFNHFYIKAFSVVFNVAIERAAAADDVKIRVNNLTDCITYCVFMYTTRGLFEADKLIFTAQMAFQVKLGLLLLLLLLLFVQLLLLWLLLLLLFVQLLLLWLLFLLLFYP